MAIFIVLLIIYLAFKYVRLFFEMKCQILFENYSCHKIRQFHMQQISGKSEKYRCIWVEVVGFT